MDHKSESDSSAADRFAQAPDVMPPSFTPARVRHEQGASAASPALEHSAAQRSEDLEPTPLIDGAKKTQHSMLMNMLQWVSLVAIALLVAVVGKTFFVQSFVIPSGSMENTLLPGDRIFVNKLADQADELHRGDVVVFRDPGGWLEGVQQPKQGQAAEFFTRAGEAIGLIPKDLGTHLVKRIVGVGGDHVVCCSDAGNITVNGVAVTEPYVRAGVKPSDVPFDVTVPKGYLWVMGDNRSNSQDSRYHQAQTGFGFVPVSSVEGRAWMIFYPFNRFGWITSGDSAFAQVPNNAG